MGAQASVTYDAQYLRDLLVIEGLRPADVSVHAGGTAISIDLSDDRLLDGLVELLAKEQRERQIRALRNKVQGLERKHSEAIAARQAAHAAWEDSNDRQRAVHSELYAARQALLALNPEESEQ
jgi:hypothetical protein